MFFWHLVRKKRKIDEEMLEVKVVLRKKVNPFLLDMIRSPSRKYRNSQNTAIFVYLTAKRKDEVNSPVSFIVCAYSAGKF